MNAAESWREELQSAWLYQRLAQAEAEPTRRELFATLGAAADRQAEIWAARLTGSGMPLPPFVPSTRARIVAALLRRLGPRPLLPILSAMKLRGLSVYRGPAAPGGHPRPTRVEEIGRRHRGFGGSNLRAAVFGVNDGLVSNLSLIMGIAGTGSGLEGVLTAGIAGLLAGALSMAAGEYISMRSQREMFEYQIGLERDELEAYPQEEAEELALIYAARGMELEAARRFTEDLVRRPEQALDVLAREELGLDPTELGSPWGAALFSFLAFGAGAVIPLVPFGLGLPATWVVPAAAGLAGGALFAVGLLLSLYSGRNAIAGGLRMLGIGAAAAAVTFVIGRALGVSLA